MPENSVYQHKLMGSCMKEDLYSLHFMHRMLWVPEKPLGQGTLRFPIKMWLAPMKWNTASPQRSTFPVHQIGKLCLCPLKLSALLLLLVCSSHCCEWFKQKEMCQWWNCTHLWIWFFRLLMSNHLNSEATPWLAVGWHLDKPFVNW